MTSPGYVRFTLDEIMDPDLSIMGVMLSGEVDAHMVGVYVEVRKEHVDRFFSLINGCATC